MASEELDSLLNQAHECAPVDEDEAVLAAARWPTLTDLVERWITLHQMEMAPRILDELAESVKVSKARVQAHECDGGLRHSIEGLLLTPLAVREGFIWASELRNALGEQT